MEVLSPSSSIAGGLDRSADSHYFDCKPPSLGHLRMASSEAHKLNTSLSSTSLYQDTVESPTSMSGSATPSNTDNTSHTSSPPPAKALHLALNEITNFWPGSVAAAPTTSQITPSTGNLVAPTPQPSPASAKRSAATFTFFEEDAVEVLPEQGQAEIHIPIASTSQLPDAVALPTRRSSVPISPKRSRSSPALSAPTSPADISEFCVTPSTIGPNPIPDVQPVKFVRQMSDSALVQSMTQPESGHLPQPPAHRSERRYRTLCELVTTEEGYVQDLRILVHVYLDTMAFLSCSTPENNAAIRRNADALLAFHERFLQRLSKIDEDLQWRIDETLGEVWDDGKVLLALERISQILLSETESLQLYADFCAKHADAMVLLRQYEASRVDWEAYQNNCAMQIAMRFPSSALSIGARLRIRDYAIKPIQRICRYPMMLIALEKLVDVEREEEAQAAEAAKRATEAVKVAAEEVNAAKAQMEVERKSALVARRLEIPQSIQPTFLSVLGYVHLVGGLYHIRYPSAENAQIKVSYLGSFLYTTHLVLVKVRRADCYEPRHWLPLRAFDVESVSEEGSLPFSFRLVHGDQRFDFAATGLAEKNLWIKRLTEAIAVCREAWSMVGADTDHFDETAISSVPVDVQSMPISPDPSSHSAAVSEDEDEALNQRVATGSPMPLHLRSRLSQSTLTFLGRTPSANRATVDSRLSDVISDECLTARAAHERTAASRSSSPNGRLREKEHRRQTSAPIQPGLVRSATTRDAPAATRRKSFADTIKPSVNTEIPKARRLSVDIPGTVAFQTNTKAPPPMSRSNTVGATSNAKRLSWAGSFRMRTKSLLNSPILSDEPFVEQADVARNGSHSSSGSSHPSELHTPSLSPASTCPPSPLITPEDNGPWTGLRGVLGSLSRKSSFTDRPLPVIASAEQNAQAIYASEFLYGSGDKGLRVNGQWVAERPTKRPSRGSFGSQRQSSSASLLSLFRPALSPTAPSPTYEKTDPMETAVIPSSPPRSSGNPLYPRKADPPAEAVSDVVQRTLLDARPNGSTRTRRKSIKAFRQIARMTTMD